ncbi:hypothetical protein DFQ28_009808 [Apophysomyces sp. BC1034]|nr:hypothetical protein DFQ30_009517 [Apophysomyces sp. BC1015]KAG0181609.1 hypothetical protein DFQ29_007713 [Apophysomyces sp. BC1021]KAG0192234.1 hypothetical protein DFQ28_009808 [Apophysomyces sp. BC1034]
MASEAPSNAKQERSPGTTFLPLARVKRVIKEDKDVSLINAEATFCVAYATELFMEYLITEGFDRAKRDKRKTVFYKDLASAVSEVEQFEFLEDVIPQTMTLKAAIERRKGTVEDDGSGRSNKKQKLAEEDAEDKEKNDESMEDTHEESAPDQPSTE